MPPPTGHISPVIYRIMAYADPPDEDPALAPLSRGEIVAKLYERFGKAVRTYPYIPVSALASNSRPLAFANIRFSPQVILRR
jgi:hypothetical protein